MQIKRKRQHRMVGQDSDFAHLEPSKYHRGAGTLPAAVTATSDMRATIRLKIDHPCLTLRTSNCLENQNTLIEFIHNQHACCYSFEQ